MTIYLFIGLHKFCRALGLFFSWPFRKKKKKKKKKKKRRNEKRKNKNKNKNKFPG